MELLYTETELIDAVKKNSPSYIYGLGEFGKQVLKRFEKKNISIDGIIETDPKIDSYFGIKVLSPDSLPNDENILVIITTSQKYHAEIAAHLQNVSKILAISNKLAHDIKCFNDPKLQFQIHLVEHCNLKCRGCYHFSSLADEEFLSVEEFERDIEQLSKLFNKKMERVLLLGGEPLLHPRVAEFFKIVRKYFPLDDSNDKNQSIHILTNGTMLLNMKKDFFDSVRETKSEIWVTKYPVSFDYDSAEKLAESYGTPLHYFNKEPVRSLGHQPLDIKGTQDYVYNFNHCYRANLCIDLKHGKMFSCIIPAEIEPFKKYFNLDIKISDQDYVDIYEVKTGEELLKKLWRPMPFCRYCNRESIKRFGVIPWSRTHYNIEEWTD